MRAVRDREPRPGAYDSRVWYSASVARECGGSYGDRVSRLRARGRSGRSGRSGSSCGRSGRSGRSDDGIEWGNLFS